MTKEELTNMKRNNALAVYEGMHRLYEQGIIIDFEMGPNRDGIIKISLVPPLSQQSINFSVNIASDKDEGRP